MPFIHLGIKRKQRNCLTVQVNITLIITSIKKYFLMKTIKYGKMDIIKDPHTPITSSEQILTFCTFAF